MIETETAEFRAFKKDNFAPDRESYSEFDLKLAYAHGRRAPESPDEELMAAMKKIDGLEGQATEMRMKLQEAFIALKKLKAKLD